jgi:hypothetical protein
MTGEQPCRECGAFGAHGLGPPLAAWQEWLCTFHWHRDPRGQAMIIKRVAAAGEDEDIDQAINRK